MHLYNMNLHDMKNYIILCHQIIFAINYINISHMKINFMLFMLLIMHKLILKNITFLISQEIYLHNVIIIVCFINDI